MSVFSWHSSWNSWRPTVDFTDATLHFQTSFWLQTFSLFSFKRESLVCRRERMVRISTRKFWFFVRRHEIPFRRIKTPGMRIGFLTTRRNWWYGETQDGMERCTIYLDLIDPEEEVIVTSTCGDAPVLTGWKGVLMGDSLIDTSGSQVEDAEDYVKLLRQYTATTLR